jgi:hypothetical protein
MRSYVIEDAGTISLVQCGSFIEGQTTFTCEKDLAEITAEFSVTIGVALAVISLGVLIYFIHHIAESIQVGHVIDVVSRELHAAVSRIFPAGMAETGDDEEPALFEGKDVKTTQEGYLQTVDERALITLSEKLDVVLKLLRRPGDLHYLRNAARCRFRRHRGGIRKSSPCCIHPWACADATSGCHVRFSATGGDRGASPVARCQRSFHCDHVHRSNHVSHDAVGSSFFAATCAA